MIASIVNQQGHNYGDEAAGCALVRELCEHKYIKKVNIFYASDSEIPVNHVKIKHHIDVTIKNMGLINIINYLIYPEKRKIQKIRNWALRQFVDGILESDIIFVSPCGASMGIYRDWRYLLRLLIVIKTGKNPVFHFNTIGKSGNILFDRLSKYILKKSVVYVREKASYVYLKKIGISSEVGPDSAFLLPQITASKVDEMAFIPAHLDDWHPFFKKNNIDSFVNKEIIKKIAEWSKDNAINVKIIPHFNLKREKEYCQEIQELFVKYGVENKHVKVCENVNSYIDYDNEIANSRFVIGMRYHAIVLAAKNATPFISFAYENKMKEVSSYMKQENYCIDLTEIQHGEIVEKLLLYLNKIIIHESEIRKELKSYYKEKNKAAKSIVECYCGERE